MAFAVSATLGVAACGDADDAEPPADQGGVRQDASVTAEQALPTSMDPNNPWKDAKRWPQPDFEDPHGASEDVQIREVISDVQKDFPARIGSGVCHELSPAGQREIVDTGIGVYDTCEKILPEIVRRVRLQRIPPRFSEVLAITIEGKRATALIQDPGGQPQGIPLVKVPVLGWKLPSLTLLEPVDMEQLAGLKPDSIDPRVRGDRIDIREVLADTQSDFAAGYGFNVCSELTEREQERLAHASFAPKRGDCGSTVDELFKRMRKAGIERWSSKVVSIKIAGDNAVAMVTDRHRAGAPPRPIRFHNNTLRGGWKLARLAAAEPVGEALRQ